MNDLEERTTYGTITKSDSIVYTTMQTEDGWTIEAHVPQLVPASDRQSVLRWFEAYRHDIHKKYPLWATSFTTHGDRYCLEIKQNNNVIELLNILQTKVASSWDEDPAYGR